MNDLLANLDARLRQAIVSFWSLRGAQSEKQGGNQADKDRGDRSAVTGGKHLDGFRELIAMLLEEAGLQRAVIYWRKKTELPGWFRAEKNWDLLIVADGKLVAIVEFKSQVGSFGNNFNNRTEEALGNATDLWAAYEEGASYAKRYELLLTKLVRARLYDAACLILSSRDAGLQGNYRETNSELGFHVFVTSLLARAIAVARTQPLKQAAPPPKEMGRPTEEEKSRNREHN